VEKVYGITYVTDEYWSFPSETMRDKMGNCHDRAILLVSIARAKWPGMPIYVTIGNLKGYGGHAWVTIDRGGRWELIETTFPPEQVRAMRGKVMYEMPPYFPQVRFNDKDVIVYAGT